MIAAFASPGVVRGSHAHRMHSSLADCKNRQRSCNSITAACSSRGTLRAKLSQYCQPLLLTAALFSAQVGLSTQVLAVPTPTETPGAGAGVVAGTEAVLEEQNATVRREDQKEDKVRSLRMCGIAAVHRCEEALTLPCFLSQIFLTLKVDNEEKGTVKVALYRDVPTGAQRFAELAEGKNGVGYRLSRIDTVGPVCALKVSDWQRLQSSVLPAIAFLSLSSAVQDFIYSSGVRSLSYAAGSDDNDSALQQLQVGSK